MIVTIFCAGRSDLNTEKSRKVEK